MRILTTMTGLPLAYHKYMQEDKEGTFNAIDTTRECLIMFMQMMDSMKFRKEVMERSATKGFTNATDAADYLVKRGVPFRDAHGIIGRLVLECIEKGKSIDEMTLEELKNISEVFDADIYEAVSLKTCVEKRLTTGAPGISAMKSVIEEYKKYLKI